MTERVFTYTRVSTDIQKERGTHEGQQQAISRFIKENGLILIHEFEDLGLSGADRDRPGLNAMLDRLDEVDGIVVWDWDRLTRDEEFGLSLPYLFKGRGKFVYQVRNGQKLTFETFSDRLVTHLGTMIAAEERRKMREAVKRGIRNFREEHGYWGPHKQKWGKYSEKTFWKKYDELVGVGVPKTVLASHLGVSRSTLYRRLKERKVDIKEC